MIDFNITEHIATKDINNVVETIGSTGEFLDDVVQAINLYSIKGITLISHLPINKEDIVVITAIDFNDFFLETSFYVEVKKEDNGVYSYSFHMKDPSASDLLQTAKYLIDSAISIQNN